MERESFKSRLGFILISAGCAIGIGNVWRFPYMVGEYGGGFFVLFYLFFLVAVGVPVMTMEFAVGRASRRSAVQAYRVLEKPGQKWHIHGYVALLGNYVLMMFYTSVTGWMLDYFFRYATGRMEGLDQAGAAQAFSGMLADTGNMMFWMLLVVLAGFAICSLGLQKGVERITKWMMLALLALIVLLAIHSILLPGGQEGLRFYLLPDWQRLQEAGLWNTISGAMYQSFFTLSLGIGAMALFGSYMGRQHSLLGESVRIAALDTFVAFVSGLIIFPACFTYGVSPDNGPSLIFITLPPVFNQMEGGRFWGALFFLFMSFAAFSTIIAVFENILSCCMEQWGWSRRKAAAINVVVVALASLPCVFGYSLWSDFQPLGPGSAVLDLEDFVVSNLLLPIGSLVYLLFCVSRWGWGFKNYLAEANTGQGLKIPKGLRLYFTWVIPVLIFILLIQGIAGVVAKL